MVYATVEIVVVAGLIAFWSAYPRQRFRWWPIVAVHAIALVLSLTRMAWITCLLLVAINLIWRRSKWIWALPLFPVLLYIVAPESVQTRVLKISDLTYYSNSERLQMLAVGWKMVSEYPLTGVGPGRVDSLYESYLEQGDPVPSWHGHLHNNLMQTAAQFGIPVTLAAMVFVAVALRDLIKARKCVTGPDGRFLTETALLSMIGFLFAGMFEYTWGHSLGLIMIAFAFVPALIPSEMTHPHPEGVKEISRR
jgi:O-antigen ligase